MFLLIRMMRLEGLKIVDRSITRTLGRRFYCLKCNWILYAKLYLMFLKSLYCLFYCLVSGEAVGPLQPVHLKIAQV